MQPRLNGRWLGPRPQGAGSRGSKSPAASERKAGSSSRRLTRSKLGRLAFGVEFVACLQDGSQDRILQSLRRYPGPQARHQRGLVKYQLNEFTVEPVKLGDLNKPLFVGLRDSGNRPGSG